MAHTALIPSLDEDIERTVRVLVDPGDMSVRGAFARRALRAVVRLSGQMGEASLREAVSAPTDYGVLLTALESEPGLSLLSQEDPLAEARLRGIEARRQLLAAEGGTVGIQQVADLLKISRQAVYKRHRAGRLLAVDCGRHGYAFPVWQLVPGGVLPGLEKTLRALSDLDPWMKLAFFLGETVALKDVSPLEALRKGQLDDVLRAAQLYGEHGAV